MDLISTHIGADLDALASVLAARKIYPESEIFFPGGQEESVRRVLESGLVRIREIRQRHIDPARLSRVILCDIRRRDRIGVLGEWLAERPEVEVLAYDHHPDTDTDLAICGGRVDPALGSTSALMVEELESRGLPLLPAEATLLLMGIHEDTGSLTYTTASARDYRAAAWLLDAGADLEAVRRYAIKRWDPPHLELVERMVRELEVRTIHDQRLGIVALEVGRHVDEAAPLVNRCLEIFELPLLFAIFGEGRRTAVIARGQALGVDLGEILSRLIGGGGHPTAAAGRVKDLSAAEVRERLLAGLEELLPPALPARALAVANDVRIPRGTTVEGALEVLALRRINSALVVEPMVEPVAEPVAEPAAEPTPREGAPEGRGRPLGAITRQVLDSARLHGLGSRPVETVMNGELAWVEPEAPARRVVERMLERYPRFVVVGERESGTAQGLITRLAVLRHLGERLSELEQAPGQREEERQRQGARLLRLLSEGVLPEVRSRVETVTELVRATGRPVYLVGGFVRDLLLGQEHRDLDLVVLESVTDGFYFARRLAQALGARLRTHPEFLTADLVDPEGFHIDLTVARSELYREVASLPEVQPAPLMRDLQRRDFTVNTLAVRLAPGELPSLVDHFGGGRDLEDRTLRVIHSLSFLDDPTRLLRGVRLEARLGLRMAPDTERLARVALAEGAFERLSAARLCQELITLLDDPRVAVSGLERLADLGALDLVLPGLAWSTQRAERLRRAIDDRVWLEEKVKRREAAAKGSSLEATWGSLWRLLLLLLADGLSPEARKDVAARYLLGAEARSRFLHLGEHLDEFRQLMKAPQVAASRVAAALGALSREEILFLLTSSEEPARGWVRRYLEALEPLRLRIRGADLIAAGVQPGPAVGEALRRTLDARLDGLLDAEGELSFALGLLGIEVRSQLTGSSGATPREDRKR